MFVKYFTSPTFKREKFAEVLREKMNVPAYAVDDGIILDRTAFYNAPAISPWVEMNRGNIMSPFHTRAATESEIFRLHNPERYELFAGGVALAKSHDLSELVSIALANYGLYIVDMDTGELLWEA